VTANVVSLPPCKYSLSANALNFGVLPNYGSSDRTVTLHNEGTAAGDTWLIYAAQRDPYFNSFILPTFPGQTVELEPGQNLEVRVRGSGTPPPIPFVYPVSNKVTLQLSSDVAPNPTIPVSGHITPDCLTITPSAPDFGSAKVGCSKAERALELYGR